ncbi:helix-turn-helix transcriptional regulator [Nocardia sp. NBC_00881]|uniref:helix-turn-helix transcriptional regulator n=1 Tax=Nocardia sp. NBC_00881 TaxID=2975995 RepID=UPI0038709206|nr:helix-turn-helix transcriptional regulator [Nocardia sp. NBC_00881]
MARHDPITQAADSLDLFTRVSARLRERVIFDAAAWSTTDPETGLVTAPMWVQNLDGGTQCYAYWECELLEETVIPFRELARSTTPAGALRWNTGDLPGRSAQYRRLRGQGLMDELRAVLRAGNKPWGVVSLFRNAGREPFGQAEIDLVAAMSASLGARLRSFARPSAAPALAGTSAPGMILFTPDGTATSINQEARHYLALLPDGPSEPSALGVRLPIWVVGTAVQARAVASERDGRTARVRIRTRDGGWIACHASCLSGPDGLPGPTALIIEPAPASDMAPIIAEAYGLSRRELEITQHIARGLATTEIAAALFISAHTVRDHIRAIFDKTEVSSRGELVARLFTENYWPLRNRPGATAYGRV